MGNIVVWTNVVDVVGDEDDTFGVGRDVAGTKELGDFVGTTTPVGLRAGAVVTIFFVGRPVLGIKVDGDAVGNAVTAGVGLVFGDNVDIFRVGLKVGGNEVMVDIVGLGGFVGAGAVVVGIIVVGTRDGTCVGLQLDGGFELKSQIPARIHCSKPLILTKPLGRPGTPQPAVNDVTPT